MLASSLLSFLAVASIAQGFPLEELDTSLAPRTTGETVTGPLHTTNGGGAGGSDSGTSVKSTSGGTGASQYNMYTGDGKSWPSQDQWIGDFVTMFENNKEIMKGSCTQFGKPNPSDTEIQDMRDGIIAAETASGLDKRFILAIMMQESNGCPRVPTTNAGVVNPGLMQDHAGIDCTTPTTCPTATIHQMILEGTAGTDSGDGLANCINQASNQGASGAQAFYWAARIYNTGSYTAGSDLGTPKYGTSCYSSDVANRLLGWTGSNSPCQLKNPGR